MINTLFTHGSERRKEGVMKNSKVKKPVSKSSPKPAHRLVNFRITSREERRMISRNARKFAKGNVSAWLRFAGSNFSPKKVPASLGR